VIKPGDLIKRTSKVVGDIVLLRRPLRPKQGIIDLTGMLRGNDVGFVIAVNGDWSFVMSHEGIGWVKSDMLVH